LIRDNEVGGVYMGQKVSNGTGGSGTTPLFKNPIQLIRNKQQFNRIQRYLESIGYLLL